MNVSSKILSYFAFCFVMLAIAGYSELSFAVDYPLDKFKDSETELPQRYKSDNTADDHENIRVIELLKSYAKEYTPIPIADDIINTIEFTFGARNWHLSYGRKYSISGYEVVISAYVNQLFGELDRLEPLVIYSNNNVEDDQRFRDLEYTFTTFGLSAGVYYFSFFENNISLGFEVPLFALARLSIDSEDADKSYVVNGGSLLGLLIVRHTNIVPLKIRYRLNNNFAMLLNVHWSSFDVHQETENDPGENIDNRRGEWLEGCGQDICNINEFIPALGVEVVF